MATPAYQRIADDIRRRIATGELATGDRLHTASEIAKQWNVSGAVVTQALGVLKTEGLLASAPARGTYVLPQRKLLTWVLSDFENQRADTYSADAWALAIQNQDMEPSSTVTERRVQASTDITNWLEIDAGETVIARDRVRYADGQPYMLSTSYFPKWVAAGTRLEEPGDQSAPGGLLTEVNHPQVRARDIITAPAASGDQVRSLYLPQGSRVWSIVRIGYGADGRPVRAMHTTAPIDLWSLEFSQAVLPQKAPSPFLSRDYPPDPYPGSRPGVSFVELDGAGWALSPDPESHSGWSVDTGQSALTDLDKWLAAHDATPMSERLPVLAYGSNECPGKIPWMRDTLGLSGPAVVALADVQGLAAVWSAGERARDRQRPAVLAAMEGVAEQHAVWFVTPAQRAVLDEVEGRGGRYRLGWVHAPVTLANGEHLEWVLAYTARPEVIGRGVDAHLNRSPLLVDGRMVRVADMGQDEVRSTEGTSGDSDGLEVIEPSAEEPSWNDLPTTTPPQ